MQRDPALIDLFAEVLGDIFDARRFGDRVLGLLLGIEQGRSGALFKVTDEKPTLIVGRSIDQAGLERVETLWGNCRDSLAQGEIFYTPDVDPGARLRGASNPSGPISCALIPVIRDRTLLGLLYLDSTSPDLADRGNHETLAKFAEIVAPAVVRAVEDESSTGTWERVLEAKSVEEIEREKLILLLRRHRWNITHVAALMGITRATMYQRLQRHGIVREKPSSRLQRKPATT